MSNDLKEIIHAEINEPLNKIVDIFSPKPKIRDNKLFAFWVIVGFLTVVLLYYSYQMLSIYF